MLDRFAIDDGRHLPAFVIDEDASSAAGEARYRAACSCGRMPPMPAGPQEQARAAHLAHVKTRLHPSKGPAWLPEGARIALLALAMLATFAASYAGGQVIIHDQDITGATANLVIVSSVLSGYTLAFGLMVAVRRYIAPTRA